MQFTSKRRNKGDVREGWRRDSEKGRMLTPLKKHIEALPESRFEKGGT